MSNSLISTQEESSVLRTMFICVVIIVNCTILTGMFKFISEQKTERVRIMELGQCRVEQGDDAKLHVEEDHNVYWYTDDGARVRMPTLVFDTAKNEWVMEDAGGEE